MQEPTTTLHAYTARQNRVSKQIPQQLWNDEIYLNGQRMTVSGEGVLPTFPIPGKVVTTEEKSSVIVFPPFSYGFVVLPHADVVACKH